jgi:hypothetical protein
MGGERQVTDMPRPEECRRSAADHAAVDYGRTDFHDGDVAGLNDLRPGAARDAAPSYVEGYLTGLAEQTCPREWRIANLDAS